MGADQRLSGFLELAEPRIDVTVAVGADSARAALASTSWDAIVIAHTIAPMSVPDVVAHARQNGNIPVIVVAKKVKADGTVALIRAGAADVVEWDSPGRLEQAVLEAVGQRQQGDVVTDAQPGKDDVATAVFVAASEGIMVTDADNRIIAVNAEFSNITGYTANDVLGRDPGFLASDRRDPASVASLWAALKSEGRWSGELWNRRHNGEDYPVWMSISCFRDRSGGITKHIAIFTDITERKREEDRLREQATHDVLTGLPNRGLFHDRVLQAVALARRNGRLAALLFVDLDGFKKVNDKYGHRTGDLLLVGVASRLSKAIRESDTAARLGGDEFAVVLNGVSSRLDIMRIARKLAADLHRPYTVEGNDVAVGASIGIAIFPEHAQTSAELLALADAAMYRPKSRAKGGGNGALVVAQIVVPGRAA